MDYYGLLWQWIIALSGLLLTLLFLYHIYKTIYCDHII